MTALTLFDNGHHRNILLEDFSEDSVVQSSQHLIIDGTDAMILDPGGHRFYRQVMSATMSALKGGKLTHIFLSHQDPDVASALNGWLTTTEATAWASVLWTRFMPHFGMDRFVAQRLKGIPDEGMRLMLGQCELCILPAHFLHSPGNFHVYDPVSRILYSGDLGASPGAQAREVADFAAHVPQLEAFHRRYMASRKAAQAWVRMVRTLHVEVMAPQHGAVFRGPALVAEFLAWCEETDCGVDLIADTYRVPAK